MGIIIRILISVLVFAGGIIGDFYLGAFLFDKVPNESWEFWAKLGIVVGIIWLTGGLILTLTALSGTIKLK